MIRKTLIALVALAMPVLPAAASETTEYTIDASHSGVNFKVAHMVISKVSGSFHDFEGTIRLADDITKSSVEVTIDVASVDTGNEDRDKHLRSPDFFNAEKYPKITFKSTRIKPHGDGYMAFGELTIRDVSKGVALPFEITGTITDPWGNQRMGIDVEPIVINRQDFNVSFSKTMETGGLVVGDEVTIDIEVEAIKANKDS